MQYSFGPLIAPAAIIGLAVLSLYGDMDEGPRILLIVSAIAGSLAITMYAYSVNERIHDLEQTIEKLKDRVYDNARDGAASIRSTFQCLI